MQLRRQLNVAFAFGSACLISACGVVPTDSVVARAGVQGLRTDTPTSVVVSQSPPNTAARTLARLSRAERATFRRWVLHVELAAFYAALPVVTRWGAPTPVSSMVCPPGPIHDEIDKVFGIAAPWFQSIAWRESNCEPWARNASGSEGIGQLLGHDDLLAAACPMIPPSVSWGSADCNIRASFLLFEGSGIGPWRL